MENKRTAAAGVLLKVDGISLLLDGVGREVKPYPATPSDLWETLLQESVDGLLITHRHKDHYDATFVSEYVQKTAGPVIGPADIPFTGQEPTKIGAVHILPVKSRHIGKPDPIEHMSFILQGSKCIWFTGDASPLQWAKENNLPKPDVLIAPYAYAIGTGWQVTKELNPKTLVLLHLPKKENDIAGLWDAVERTLSLGEGPQILIPDIGETMTLAL